MATKHLQKLKCLPDPFEIDLEVPRLGLGADLFLGSRHQLRQSWHCEYSQLVLPSLHSPPPTKSRNLVQPETVAHRPPETEGTHAASDICAVVHMVLVKCVWMPTSSYATKYRDVLESCLGALQCFFLSSSFSIYL